MTFSVMNYGTETWSVYTNTSFLFHGITKQELLLSLLEGDCNRITLFFVSQDFHSFIYGMIIRNSENQQIQLTPVEAVGI